MKKNYVAIAVIAVLLIACALGGWALASANRGGEVAQPSSTPTASPTPTEKSVVLPEFSSTSPTPSPTNKAPIESETPSTEPAKGETVTKDADGSVTINPNWSTDKIPEDANVVPRQAETNMSGGGGQMTTGKDGVYRGDQPSAAPSPSPSASIAPSTAPSTSPSAAPSGNTSTPKNGEISQDGKQVWFEGFGWVDRDIPNGGDGGVLGQPGDQLTGNKVGDMG